MDSWFYSNSVQNWPTTLKLSNFKFVELPIEPIKVSSKDLTFIGTDLGNDRKSQNECEQSVEKAVRGSFRGPKICPYQIKLLENNRDSDQIVIK